jgi:hypothetical protein
MRLRAPSRGFTPGILIHPSPPSARRAGATGLVTPLVLMMLVAALLLVAGPLRGRAWAVDASAAPATDDSREKAEEKAEQTEENQMTPEARASYERGLAQYRAKDYAAAIHTFEEGFAHEQHREFLFANAQARRLAGDCRGAVPLYQRFLGMSPPSVQASATQIALARCAQQMAAARVEPLAPPSPVPAPPPWTHDRTGAVVLATGVVGLVVGGGFLAAALAARPAPDLPTYDEHAGAQARAETRLSIAVVGFVGGGALVAAGVARYAWVRHRRNAVTLTVVPGGLALGGSF